MLHRRSGGPRDDTPRRSLSSEIIKRTDYLTKTTQRGTGEEFFIINIAEIRSGALTRGREGINRVQTTWLDSSERQLRESQKAWGDVLKIRFFLESPGEKKRNERNVDAAKFE